MVPHEDHQDLEHTRFDSGSTTDQRVPSELVGVCNNLEHLVAVAEVG